ncbi:hypothetical protein VSU19_00215 [Verrucomicrobiales bacterium BCK34]|nr:hypothetical protein [Verrucomicrobiales bacterium BCK34]
MSVREQTEARIFELCGEITQGNARKIATSIPSYFDLAPTQDGFDPKHELRLGQFQTALGHAYATAFASITDWTFDFLGFEQDNFDPEDGINTLVSPDNSVIIFPIAEVRKDYYKGSDCCNFLIDAVLQGDIPSHPEDSFVHWNPDPTAPNKVRDSSS